MRGVAVCCGFNSYHDVRSLERAVNDAAILYTRLTESGMFNASPELIGRGELFTQPTTAAAILSALARAAMSTAELVWFSFSGHAIVLHGELRLLLPGWQHDASDEHDQRYSIGVHEIEHVLRSQLARKKFVIVLDACYSGAFGSDSVTRDVARPVEEQIASAGAVVMSSCARDQLALDGEPGSRDLNGAFTATVIKILEEHTRGGTPLSVLQLFFAAKHQIQNGQIPTLHVNGLTDDFWILGPERGVDCEGIVPLCAEVPAQLKTKLSTFLTSVVHIHRRRRVGLLHAERQLQSLAAEFYRYGDDTFVVPSHNSNVIEAFENARRSIVGCTTVAYLEEWRRAGNDLLAANREFVARQGGRVVRLFFARDDLGTRTPEMLDVVRAHLEAGVIAVIVNVDAFGPAVLQEVFKEPRPSDLSCLECAFVDGRIFLRTHFVANGGLKIEVDQRPTRCQNEYKAQVRPFLSALPGGLFSARLAHDGAAGIALAPLDADDVGELRLQLDTDLGFAAA
ncbi:MAG TPA: caspase family protein [Kofleriaceae bacterium]|nr:caspase family protein [Kofleriaceae bacterium]